MKSLQGKATDAAGLFSPRKAELACECLTRWVECASMTSGWTAQKLAMQAQRRFLFYRHWPRRRNPPRPHNYAVHPAPVAEIGRPTKQYCICTTLPFVPQTIRCYRGPCTVALCCWEVCRGRRSDPPSPFPAISLPRGVPSKDVGRLPRQPRRSRPLNESGRPGKDAWICPRGRRTQLT